MLIDEIGDVKVIAHRNCENVLETGKSVIPNGFYPFTEKISKKLKSKKNFSKNIFPKLEKNDMEKVIFIDFLKWLMNKTRCNYHKRYEFTRCHSLSKYDSNWFSIFSNKYFNILCF